jgi:SRSO17 transposase
MAAGHADRVVPIENYINSLMLPIVRKSIEPMTAHLALGRVSRIHQSLYHVVADQAWREDVLLRPAYQASGTLRSPILQDRILCMKKWKA